MQWGLTKVTTKIISLEQGKGVYEDILLVNAGAIDSLAPHDKLEEIGVHKQGKMVYELADGIIKEQYYDCYDKINHINQMNRN